MGSASDARRAREASARRVRKRLGSPGLKRASEATIKKVTRSSGGGGGGSKRVTTVVTGAPASAPERLGETTVTETLPTGQTVQVTAEAGVKQREIERAVTQARAEAGREYRQAMIQKEVAQTRASVFEQEVAQQLRAKGYLTKGEIDALGQRYNLTASEKKQLQKEVGGARLVPGQYTPVSPLTSTFYQQIQLRQRPEPGTGTVRALTGAESAGLGVSRAVGMVTPGPYKKVDAEAGIKSVPIVSDVTELARTGFKKITKPVQRFGARAVSVLPEGQAKQDIIGAGRGILSGAEIALVDYPIFFPTYAGGKFAVETVATGGQNIQAMAGGIVKGVATRETRAQTLGELATVGIIAPKAYKSIPRVQYGYGSGVSYVAKPYRAEALALQKAQRVTRDLPLEPRNVDFTRFESTRGNKPAQQAIKETLLENPDYVLGGSIILEQTGTKIQRRPQDYDIYTDVPTKQVIQTFEQKLKQAGVKYEVRGGKAIYIKTGKGQFKEAVTVHGYSIGKTNLAQTQASVRTIKQRFITGITTKSPEGITISKPELITRRKIVGGFERPRKGQLIEFEQQLGKARAQAETGGGVLYRYSKDIPAGVQATTAILERLRERAQTLPAPFKQIEQFKVGYAQTYLRGFEPFLKVERVQPVPYRKLPQLSTLERTRIALKEVDIPKFEPGRRGQLYVPQPGELYRGFQAVRPRLSSLPIRFERPGARPTQPGGLIEAVKPVTRDITRVPTQYPRAPKRVTRAVPSGYTVRSTPTSYKAPSGYRTRAPRSYAPSYPSGYAPTPTSYRPVSYTPTARAPSAYTAPPTTTYTAPTRYTPPRAYAPSYTVPTYAPPRTPPTQPPKTRFKADFELPEFKPTRRQAGLKVRQPRAYIPTLRATVGGIKAPRKGAKTKRLTGLEERPLLF